jgi:hypothetical protein
MIFTAKVQIILKPFFILPFQVVGEGLVPQTELPACGILHLLHNLYIDMIYGKTKINGCEKIVKRLCVILEYLERDRGSR